MHCGSTKVRCCLWCSVFKVRFLIWMIDSSQANSWRYCNYALRGLTYMGSVNITEEGLTCQRWDSSWPHVVASNITDADFPDGSKNAAHNFCRSLYLRDRSENCSNAPWCYTTDPNVSWQYCKPSRDDIGSEEYTAYSACVLEKNGAGYSGYVTVTMSGFPCDLWRYHRNSTYVFPDGSARTAKNYCRNPTPISRQGPWCYTTSDLVPWDYCDVCIPYRGSIVRKEKTTSKDRVKLPSMPLTNCLHWCISFVSCVGIDFKRDEVECWYTQHKSTTVDSDRGYDHYDVERICPEMDARLMKDGEQKRGERTTSLQKHPVTLSYKSTLKIHGISETVFEERNTAAPRTSLLTQKLDRGGIGGPGQVFSTDRAEGDLSASGSVVREGSERKAGSRHCPGTLIGESHIDSRYKNGGVRGRVSGSGRLLREKRSQRLVETEGSRRSGRQKAAVKNGGATVLTEGKGRGRRGGTNETPSLLGVDDVMLRKETYEHQLIPTTKNETQEEGKKSELAKVLSYLMIAMTTAVFISTTYAFVTISFVKKEAGQTANPGRGTPARNDQMVASRKLVSDPSAGRSSVSVLQ